MNIEHNLRVATININRITPINLAYIILLLVLHDTDVLTIQDTRLSTNQGEYYADWFKDLMGWILGKSIQHHIAKKERSRT